MANPWFRMYAEFATDAKVQSMPESMQRRLTMLFCLRCSDVTVTLSDDELAFAMRISDEELAETKALFMRKGFIDESWDLLNWEKRQFASDSSAERTRAYRERQKQKQNDGETSQKRHSDALDTDTDTDTEKKQKKTKAPAVPSPIDLLVEHGVDRQVASDWMELRNKKRLPLTPTAMDETKAEAVKAGLSLDEALRMCCKRGWGGFDASWINKPQARASPSGGYESAKDRSRREASENLTGRRQHEQRHDIIDI